jgi:hypothetical protein
MGRLSTYVLRNVLRNRVRTVLSLGGMAIAVGVFCFLASIESSMKRAVDEVSQTTLLVLNEKDKW